MKIVNPDACDNARSQMHIVANSMQVAQPHVASMRSNFSTYRDTLVLLTMSFMFRASLFLRRWNY